LRYEIESTMQRYIYLKNKSQQAANNLETAT